MPLLKSVQKKFPAMEYVHPILCVSTTNQNIHQNVNTVDVMFPSWPALLYANPALGKYLLEGLFRYQATGQYPNKWSVHDLGEETFSFFFDNVSFYKPRFELPTGPGT